MSRAKKVIEKYRLLDTSFVDHKGFNSVALGHGQLMDSATFQHFRDMDPSGNDKYLEWMIFQAGGGQDAMRKMIAMWEGESPTDPMSQRKAIREEFLKEMVTGYVDEHGQYQPPVTMGEATKQWDLNREAIRKEFLIGDEDVAVESGFGFYRYWHPHYDEIVDLVKLWHSEQAALKAAGIPLDIYQGWKDRYGQEEAVYKNVSDLKRALRSVRLTILLKRVEFDTIYADDFLEVICPLTIGASIKFGHSKWCTSNRTNVESCLDGGATPHWTNYTRRGPVVIFNWKCPMPLYMWKLAVHIEKSRLRCMNWNNETFIDLANYPSGRTLKELLDQITGRYEPYTQPSLAGDRERAYNEAVSEKWDPNAAKEVTSHFMDALGATLKWAYSFDCRRIETNCS